LPSLQLGQIDDPIPLENKPTVDITNPLSINSRSYYFSAKSFLPFSVKAKKI